MTEENKPPEDHLKNFAMMMPKGPAQYMKNPKKIFGWSIIWNGWPIRFFKRITPVRQDYIFVFFSWTFVKEIGRTPSEGYGFRSWTIEGFENIDGWESEEESTKK